jgi:hypothetical protein
MSMMMPPEAPPGLPIPPGGGEPGVGGPAPPMDMMNQQPLPGEGGLEALLASLGQGGDGGGLPLGDATLGGTAPEDDEEMDPVAHIQQAMKHLMMAMAKDDDDERGVGITKGMGALQAILGGEQKANKQLQALA